MTSSRFEGAFPLLAWICLSLTSCSIKQPNGNIPLAADIPHLVASSNALNPDSVPDGQSTILVKRISEAKNWDQLNGVGYDEENFINLCREISSLSTSRIRQLILAYMKTNDWRNNGWMKIYILNRVVFNISNREKIKNLPFSDWLCGGSFAAATPYNPNEFVDAMYPLEYIDTKLHITGKIYFYASSSVTGLGEDGYPVLREFDFFSQNFARRRI